MSRFKARSIRTDGSLLKRRGSRRLIHVIKCNPVWSNDGHLDFGPMPTISRTNAINMVELRLEIVHLVIGSRALFDFIEIACTHLSDTGVFYRMVDARRICIRRSVIVDEQFRQSPFASRVRDSEISIL